MGYNSDIIPKTKNNKISKKDFSKSVNQWQSPPPGGGANKTPSPSLTIFILERLNGVGKMVQSMKSLTAQAWWPEFHLWSPHEGVLSLYTHTVIIIILIFLGKKSWRRSCLASWHQYTLTLENQEPVYGQQSPGEQLTHTNQKQRQKVCREETNLWKAIEDQAPRQLIRCWSPTHLSALQESHSNKGPF